MRIERSCDTVVVAIEVAIMEGVLESFKEVRAMEMGEGEGEGEGYSTTVRRKSGACSCDGLAWE